MSTPDIAADARATIPATPARKRGTRRLFIFVLPPLIMIAGGGAYAWQAGLLPIGPPRARGGPDTPKLNIRPDSDPAHPRYKTSYLKIDGAFTTNLRDSARFIQVELGVATDYDPIVLARVQTHEIPIRSAVLAILAQQGETEVQSPAGRIAIEIALGRAVNKVLVEREGFGGVGHVYLTALVIQ